MVSRIKNSIAISLLPQIILVKWLSTRPDLVEKYYSTGIYPYISKFFRILFGWVPFSVGDILYTLLGLLAIGYCIKYRKDIRRKPFSFIRDIVMVLSVAYFTFNSMWGLNYYRNHLSEKFNLSEKHTKVALVDIVEKLTFKVNEVQFAITSDSTQAVIVPYSKQEIFELTLKGYEKLGKQNPFFKYEVPSLKKSLYSVPLAYMGYGGYLNPFTNEAQVNGELPVFRYPIVCGHEIGHQLGYSAENETNFIGYLVTVSNDDIYFKYSAYAYALSYCLGGLQQMDEPLFNELYPKLNAGTRKNYEEMNKFWTSYQNPLEPVFKSAFDSFLKANNQAEGIMSYNSVVALFISYYEQHPL